MVPSISSVTRGSTGFLQGSLWLAVGGLGFKGNQGICEGAFRVRFYGVWGVRLSSKCLKKRLPPGTFQASLRGLGGG